MTSTVGRARSYIDFFQTSDGFRDVRERIDRGRCSLPAEEMSFTGMLERIVYLQGSIGGPSRPIPGKAL